METGQSRQQRTVDDVAMGGYIKRGCEMYSTDSIHPSYMTIVEHAVRQFYTIMITIYFCNDKL